MTATRSFVEQVCHQAAEAGAVTARAMFGGHSLYCDGKLVALIGDSELFVKPTPGSRALAPDAPEAPPYPGAKPCLVVTAQIEDASWLAKLIATTAREVPDPKPKRPRIK